MDLVVLDAVMPGIGGIETCRRLRAAGVASPIALTSGDLTSELESAACRGGATYALAKPVDVLGLLGLDATAGEAEPDDRRQLIEDHIEVALNIARGLARQYGWMLAPEDIIGPAMVGLCEAAARFDYTRVEPFVAFAEQRIRGAVIDEIRRLGGQGRVTHKRQRRISAARLAITQAGDAPTDDRVAEHLGVSLSEIQRAGVRSTQAVDVDIAALPAPGASAEAVISDIEDLASLSRARETLPPQEETVVRLHYDVGMSLAEIARMLELTLGRVRHVHASGLARMRRALRDGHAGGDRASPRGAKVDGRTTA